MFRNKTFVLLINAFLAFCAVFIFFEIQQSDVVIRLNDHNLSLDAYEVRFKKDLTAAQVNQRLTAAKHVDDVQVHYRLRKNRDLTYFFGKGSFSTPPLISGNFFSLDDFTSDLSVAVVGQNLASKLYKPKDQQYLKFNGRYIPVIGVMGEKLHSSLDRQIFISPGKQKLAQMHVKDYQVMIDGNKKLKAAELKAILPIQQIHRSHSQQFVMTKWEWITAHWSQLVELFALFAVMILLIFLWRFSGRKIFRSVYKTGARAQQIRYKEWGNYSLFTGLGLLTGSLIGSLTFDIQSYGALVTYLGICFAINSLLFNEIIKKGINRSK